MLQYYKYPLKVWLVSAVLGFLIIQIYTFLFEYFDATSYSVYVGNIVVLQFFLLAGSFLLLFPAFILLWLVYWLTDKMNYSPFKLKLLMVIFAQVICFLLFLLMYRGALVGAMLYSLSMVFPYSISLLISSLAFRVKLKLLNHI